MTDNPNNDSSMALVVIILILLVAIVFGGFYFLGYPKSTPDNDVNIDLPPINTPAPGGNEGTPDNY